MAKAIWKVELAITDEQDCFLPEGAIPLHAEQQYREVCMWAIVDPSRSAKPIRVRIVGKWRHLSAVLTCEGRFVWHVFVPREVTP